MPTTEPSSPAAVMVRPPVRQRVDAAGLGVHQVGLVVLPPGLVLLGAAVVVDREQRRRRWPRPPRRGRRSTCRTRRRSRRRSAGSCAGRLPPGAQRGRVEQRLALVVGHEAPGLASRGGAGTRVRSLAASARLRRRRGHQLALGVPAARQRPRAQSVAHARCAAKATLTPRRSIDCATRRGPEASGWSSRNVHDVRGEVGVGAQGGDRLDDAGWRVLGEPLEHVVPRLGHARPDGLVGPRGWPAGRR